MLTRNSGALLFAATVVCISVLVKQGMEQEAPVKSAEQDDAERIGDLVLANHILADQGVVDGFGNVSVRSTKNPNYYFISRSRAPALMTADDIMKYDLDDHPIDARGRASYLERFIHSKM